MQKPIHICILTTAHAYDDKRVFEKIAKTFVKANFNVSWVGPTKNKPDLTLHRNLGINLNFTPPITGKFDRMISRHRIMHTGKLVNNVNVFYVPDPDAVPIALRLSTMSEAKVVFDIHEVYHDALLHNQMYGLKIPWVGEFVRRKISASCAKCSLVMGVSDAVLNHYLVPETPRLVVRSCAPLWFAEKFPAANFNHNSHVFKLMHGLSTMGRGTEVLLRALAILKLKNINIRAVMFELFVDAADNQRFQNLVNELQIESLVDMHKIVPLSQMPSIMRTCDAGLIAYGRDLGPDSLPNRLFEYMAAGIPIIAPNYSIEIAKIINTENCGLLVDMENPAEVANALKCLIHDRTERLAMGNRGREAFEKRHNWEKEVEPLLNQIHAWFQQ